MAEYNFDLLTSREIEILDLKSTGISNIQIAELLGVSRRTVEAHFVNIKRKIGCNSLFQLGYKFGDNKVRK